VRRSLPALIALAVVAGATLTGCAGSSLGASAACDVKSGSGSESLRVSGDFGKKVELKSPTPLNVTHTQATTLIEGDGKVLGKGAVPLVSLTISASQGFTAGSGGTSVQQLPTTASAIGSGLADALACARVGSRVAIVVPAKEAPSSLQLPDDATFIAVADIKSALPNRATGARRTAPAGFPTVVLAPNGQPGIVIGSHPEPKTTQSAVLRQGSGAVVKKSDQIWVQTQIVNWSDPTSATGTWENGMPTTQALSDGSVLSKELIGQKIGSQVIVLTPASKSQDGNASVTVVDILGRVPASVLQQQQQQQ
jgi:peptidylprolyl isomerase